MGARRQTALFLDVFAPPPVNSMTINEHYDNARTKVCSTRIKNAPVSHFVGVLEQKEVKEDTNISRGGWSGIDSPATHPPKKEVEEASMHPIDADGWAHPVCAASRPFEPQNLEI